MGTLLMNSQTLLNDSTCCVPCITLKKALLLKNDYTYLKNQIEITRDSVSILNSITSNQDTIIKTQDRQITLFKQNEISYKKLIVNKDEEIILFKKEIKKQKKAKIVSYIVGGSCLILSFILVI
jgi:sulfur carrier protein ThiS